MLSKYLLNEWMESDCGYEEVQLFEALRIEA